MEFKIGDTVQVKSGGPLLTVLETAGDDVTCLFFSDELGVFQRDTFPAIVLEEVDLADESEADTSEADEEDEDDEEEEAV